MHCLSSGTSGSSDLPALDMDACVICQATLAEAITLCAHSMCDSCCPAANCSLSPMTQKMIKCAEYMCQDVKEAYYRIDVAQIKTNLSRYCSNEGTPQEKMLILNARDKSRQLASSDLVLIFDMGGKIIEAIIDQLRMSMLKTAKNSITGLRLTPVMIDCFTDELADTLWSQQQVDLMNTCKAIQVSTHQNDLSDSPQQKMSDTVVWGPSRNDSVTGDVSRMHAWNSKHFLDDSQHFH